MRELSEDRTPDRREQRRSELLDAAMRVFVRDGFAKAKIEDVAAEAGMGKGTVYLYADSKEGLLKDVVRQRVLPILSEVESMGAGHDGSMVNLLKMQVRRFFREILKDERRDLMFLILSEGTHHPEISAFYSQNVIIRAQKIIRTTLSEGIRRGEFRDLQVEKLPRSILGGVMATAMWRLFFPDQKDHETEAFCEQHLDVVLNGLLPRE